MAKTPATLPAELEPRSAPLDNEQQEVFVREFCIHLNQTKAAISAGYSKKSATVQASKLLIIPNIQARAKYLLEKKYEKSGLTAKRVLLEFMRIAFVDVAQAYDQDGHLLPIHEMPEDVRRAIAGIEVEELFEGHGDSREQVGRLKKIRFWDKNKALEALAKNLQILGDYKGDENDEPTTITFVQFVDNRSVQLHTKDVSASLPEGNGNGKKAGGLGVAPAKW